MSGRRVEADAVGALTCAVFSSVAYLVPTVAHIYRDLGTRASSLPPRSFSIYLCCVVIFTLALLIRGQARRGSTPSSSTNTTTAAAASASAATTSAIRSSPSSGGVAQRAPTTHPHAAAPRSFGEGGRSGQRGGGHALAP